MKGYEKILQRIRTMRAFLSDEDACTQLMEEDYKSSSVYLALKGAITLDGPNDIPSVERKPLKANWERLPTVPARKNLKDYDKNE